LGKAFPREELQAIADICLEHDAWIISDEIHAELCFDGRQHIPMATLSPQIAQRTITLMSASKAYNIAGLKTSFMIIQDRHLRERSTMHVAAWSTASTRWAWKPLVWPTAKPDHG
jgi:cystathionine beta-lyase